jgi:hypothetical protein
VNRRNLQQPVLFVCLAFALNGCSFDPDQELAEASVSSALSTSKNTRMTRATTEHVAADGCLDPSAAAAEAAAQPTAGLYPEGCVSKRADGPSLHVEYDDCTGPFGHVTLAGGIDAELSEKSCDVLHAVVADSGDLTANDERVEYTASADITADGDLRMLDYTGDWTSKTRRGEDVFVTADLDIVVDRASACVEVSGTSSGHLGEHEFTARTEGYKVCPDACPSAGRTEVQIELYRDRTIVVEFDGSDVAKVTVDDKEHEVTMVCEGEDTDIEPSTRARAAR